MTPVNLIFRYIILFAICYPIAWLACFAVDKVREKREKREKRLLHRMEQTVENRLEQYEEHQQTERERFQQETLAASREAWQAVQEMVSTARDIAYKEQRNK